MAPPKKSSSLKSKGSGGLLSGLLGSNKETVAGPEVTKQQQQKSSTPAALMPAPLSQMPAQQQPPAPILVPKPPEPPATPTPATPFLQQQPAAALPSTGHPSPAPAAGAAAAANGTAAIAASASASTAAAAAAAAAKAGPKIGADDARAAWQPHPRVPVRLLDTYANFMILGDSGLGKTTFIKNLVSSYQVKTTATTDGSSTSLAAFQANPDALKTFLEPMDIIEAGRRLHISVMDMPGWSDDINLVRYLKVLLSFILEQRAKDYELLEGGRALNEVAMCGQLRNSVTVCVFFLPPHHLRKVDLILLCALSQVVTVIPVISKADSMTEGELEAYRQQIWPMLENPAKFAPHRSLAPLSFNSFNWANEIMATLGIDPKHLPLALVTSNVSDAVNAPGLASDLGLGTGAPLEQPLRRYKWGTAYSLNREHSDLLVLKRLLMGDRVESLYAMLDESYSRYVDFCSQYEDCGKQLPMLVQAAANTTTPYLEYDDYTKAQAALDAAQQAMSTLMAENKALLERINALERVAGRSNQALASNGSSGRLS